MYKYIKDKSEFNYNEFFEGLRMTLVIALDTEASSLDPIVADWILLQIKLMDSIYLLDIRTLDRKFVSYIVDLINSSGKKIIAHNAKYDLKIIFQGTGIRLNNIHDTMIVESLLYRGTGKEFYSLAELTQLYSGVSLDKDIRSTFENFSGDLSAEQLAYSAMDVLYLDKIYDHQIKLLTEKKMLRVYSIEMDLIPVIVDMELTGIYLDKDAWLALKDSAIEGKEKSHIDILDRFGKDIPFASFGNAADLADFIGIPLKTKKLRKALETLVDPACVRDWALQHINMNSSVQLRKILRDVYKFDIVSTNEKVLRELRDNNITPLILTYRTFEKKITTYGEDFLKHIHPVTGRIHSEFLQNGTATGRFSSINPNLQNIPTDMDYRRPFRASPGKTLITLDYSQQEYRLAGAISKDPVIISAYAGGKDMHTATAAIIFDKSIDSVTKDERGLGKTINFAVLYGSTSYGLSFNLKISPARAEELLKKFHDGYAVLSMFKSEIEREIWTRKYSSTLLGRKRYWEDRKIFVDYKDADKYEARVKREGFNHIIQGTGADITKMAMIRMFSDNPFGNAFKMVLQVHDEIVVEVDSAIMFAAEEFAKKCMLDVFQPYLGDIPAEVGSGISACWSK